MTRDIVAKLRDHLSKPIDTECAVVYLLAEVRKLLERDNPQPRPFALWLYCHWALHVNLSGQQTTKPLLERVDQFVSHYLAGLTPVGSWSLIDDHRLLREFVYFDTLREQLSALFERYGLQTQLCSESQMWFSFLTALAHVIEDGTLSIASSTHDTLNAVKSVTFRLSAKPASDGSHVPFVMEWRIALKDGRTCIREVEATPANNMISHGLTLVTT